MIASLQLGLVRGDASALPPQPAMRIAVGETCVYFCNVSYIGASVDPDVVSADGDPVDLTGWVVVFALKKRFGGAALITIALSEIDPPNGDVKLTIPASLLAGLEAGDYRADIWGVDPSSQKYPLTTPLLVPIRASVYLSSDPVTPPGPEMLLVGVPVPQVGDVGRFLQVADDDPVAFVYAEGGGGGGALAIGEDVTGGTSQSVLFVDALGRLAQAPDFFRYDGALGLFMLGDGDDPGNSTPGAPWQLDRAWDSSLGAMSVIINRSANGIADQWFITGQGESHGLIGGMSSTATALPNHFRDALFALYDRALIVGSANRAALEIRDDLFGVNVGNGSIDLQAATARLPTMIYDAGVASGAIVKFTFVKAAPGGSLNRYAQLSPDDDPALIVGVCIAGAGSGTVPDGGACTIARRGQIVPVLNGSGGAGTLARGDMPFLSRAPSFGGYLSHVETDGVRMGVIATSWGNQGDVVSIYF